MVGAAALMDGALLIAGSAWGLGSGRLGRAYGLLAMLAGCLLALCGAALPR